MKVSHLSAIVLILFISSCIDEPNFPEKPHIEFNRMSTNDMIQRDSVRIFIDFEDGDGDLGFAVGDTTGCCVCNLGDSICDPNNPSWKPCTEHPTWSMFVLDSRDQCLRFFRIPFIDPQGQSDAISGTINILLDQVCCYDPNAFGFCPTDKPTDTVVFDIFLKDRAGNFSDTIQTPPLVLRCE